MRDSELDRRRFMALGLGGVLSAPVPSEAAAQNGALAHGNAPPPSGLATPGKAFFKPSEFELLDVLVDAIIPADAQSGGAKAARVAAAIDRRLSESLDSEMQQSWRDDLAEIDRLARKMFGKSFVRATVRQRNRLLERISRREEDPKESGEYAFGTIKYEVSWHYYKSRVGLHDDLDYRGNVLLETFEGVDAATL